MAERVALIDAPERRARTAGVARVEHLEIGERRRVELQVIGFVVDAQRLHVIERLLVAGRGVAQRGAGRADARIVALPGRSRAATACRNGA